MSNQYESLGKAALDSNIVYYLDIIDKLQQKIEDARKELDQIFEALDSKTVV